MLWMSKKTLWLFPIIYLGTISWCRYQQNAEPCVPNNLLYGRYLSNQDLFDGLVNIFTTQISRKIRLIFLLWKVHPEINPSTHWCLFRIREHTTQSSISCFTEQATKTGPR